MLLCNCAYARKTKNRIILNDFRNANLLDSFYVYCEKDKKYEFVPLDRSSYRHLSKENKMIYDKVLDADNLMKRSEKALFHYTKIKYQQEAFKKNPYLIPAAYSLTSEFQKDRKYSTALYYALKVQKNDKKNKYPDVEYKSGALYYMLKYYDECITDLQTYLVQNPNDKSHNLDTYIMLADSYMNTASKQKNSNESYKQALVYADKALTLDQDNYKALEVKYTTCYELKSYRSAMNVSAKLLQLKPDEYNNSLKYANCRSALNDKKTELIYLYKTKTLMEGIPENKEQKTKEEIAERIKNLEQAGITINKLQEPM